MAGLAARLAPPVRPRLGRAPRPLGDVGPLGARAATLKERNRLLVLLRHGSFGLLARALVRYVLVTGSYARRDVVGPLRAGAPGAARRQVTARLRAFGGFLRLAPAMVGSRRADRAAASRRT